MILRDLWGNDITVIIAFVVSGLSLLSYFLAINEYYNKKAYWDYYHVHDKCRSTMRSGFHAEYLSYAVVLMTILVIIFEIMQKFWNDIKNQWVIACVLMCIALSLVLYVIFKVIIWKFHLTDINERLVWKSKEEYKKFIRIESNLYFKEYSICGSVILLGMFVSIKTQSLFIFGVFIISVFIFMQFENYSKRQILLSYRKWFDITIYNNQTYAIIEEYLDFFYLIKCEIDKERISLYLDNFLIVKMDCTNVETKYFSSIEKYCNSHQCNEHYKIGYRKDLQKLGEKENICGYNPQICVRNDSARKEKRKILSSEKISLNKSKEEYLMLREEILHQSILENNIFGFFYAFMAAIMAFSFTQKDTIFIILAYIIILPAYRLVLSKEIGIYKIGAYLFVFHEGEEFNWEIRTNKFHAELPHIFKRKIPTFDYPFIYISLFVMITFFLKTDWNHIYLISYELIKLLASLFLFAVLITRMIKNRNVGKDAYIQVWEKIRDEELKKEN